MTFSLPILTLFNYSALKQIDEHKDLSEDNIILASQSLRRLQLFYMIPASEMAAGKFENKTIGDPMTCKLYLSYLIDS